MPDLTEQLRLSVSNPLSSTDLPRIVNYTRCR
jgi:hypothetical protein